MAADPVKVVVALNPADFRNYVTKFPQYSDWTPIWRLEQLDGLRVTDYAQTANSYQNTHYFSIGEVIRIQISAGPEKDEPDEIDELVQWQIENNPLHRPGPYKDMGARRHANLCPNPKCNASWHGLPRESGHVNTYFNSYINPSCPGSHHFHPDGTPVDEDPASA